MKDAKPVNAMTVDVEDHFHVSALEGVITRNDWESLSRRVEIATDRVLEILADTQVRATFFTLAWVAERHPELIRRIVDGGHELASHGCDHRRITEFDAKELSEDASRSRKVLEDIGGCAVKGYRAPSFSIRKDNLWALAIIREAGFEYSSSIYPVKHDLYGIPDAPRVPFVERNSGLLEVPVTTFRVAGRNLPIGGGGFFRLYPYTLSKALLESVNRAGESCVFYTHPWEYDPEQPRYDGVPWKSQFRHYLNLHKTGERLRRLLTDMTWGRMDEVFLNRAPQAPVLQCGALGWA